MVKTIKNIFLLLFILSSYVFSQTTQEIEQKNLELKNLKDDISNLEQDLNEKKKSREGISTNIG